MERATALPGSRAATALPGRPERWGVWGALSGPPPMLFLIENDEAAVGAIDDGRSTARDQHRLLDGHAERAEPVVRRLRAQHHAGPEDLAAGPQPRRLHRLEADPVADVLPAELRH